MHQVELQGEHLHARLSCKLRICTAHSVQLLKGSQKTVLSTTLLPGGL